ncbi:MAG: peptidylprolyl isomerase [Xanthomonadales bacterium]
MRLRHPVLLCALLLLGMAAPAAADGELVWREVDPENLVFMELREGRVAIELNPRFAPRTVRQFLKLVRERFYEGLPFYRVIDGFVAQGGDGSDLGEYSDVPLIAAEFEIEFDPEMPFTPVQRNDLFADVTGFSDGFAVARDRDAGTIWLTHCPGVVAMARNEGPNTSRTDFYIVIGQAPRYLDRNMNVFGRVIDGMDVVQRIRRGPADENGIIRDDAASSRIVRMTVAADLPEDERPQALVVDTGHAAFLDLLDQRRDRRVKFFHRKPPPVLDVCQVPMAGRVTR